MASVGMMEAVEEEKRGWKSWAQTMIESTLLAATTLSTDIGTVAPCKEEPGALLDASNSNRVGLKQPYGPRVWYSAVHLYLDPQLIPCPSTPSSSCLICINLTCPLASIGSHPRHYNSSCHERCYIMYPRVRLLLGELAHPFY